MEKVIITGASGFIGSRLVLKLLKSGRQVIALGRGKNKVSYRERLHTVLDEIHGFGADKSLFENLTALDSDLCRSDLGFDTGDLDLGGGGPRILFHVAGDTSFHPCDPGRQRQVNVEGTLNVFRALGNKVDMAVHVSTAYVAGTRKGLIREDELEKGQEFHNCYEKSKFDAETKLHQLSEELSVPLVIQRPSIIINDSKTGRSSSFTHLNALVEVINRVQAHYNIVHGEVVNRQIRHMIYPHTRPNLAAVDPIVDAMIAIGTNPKSIGRTFHLCHPHPQSNAEIINLLAQAFGVKGKIEFPFITEIPDDLTWTEEMIFRSLKLYLPYMNNECYFDLSNTRSILPDYDSNFSEIDLELIDKIIQFQRSRSKAFV